MNDTPDPAQNGRGEETASAVTTRARAGKARRSVTPRTALGRWTPPTDRPDPIGVLQRSDVHRLPHLVPIRYGRMLASPFAFLRGAAAIMASDLSSTPSTGIQVQLAGDAHLANFGSYGTPERNLVFGVNDFDETLSGPWEWDLKRLVASVVVAARSYHLRPDAGSSAALATARAYREHMARYARSGYLPLYYAEIDEAATRAATALHSGKVAKAASRARTRTSLQALKTLTVSVRGQLRIKDDPPLVTHVSDPELGDLLGPLASRYLRSLEVDRASLLRRYTFVDAALKVVGVGSVGTRCFIMLFTGTGADDPLFLQIKQAQDSVLEPYLSKSPWRTHGERIVQGQRTIQPAHDVFLGWGKEERRDYYVRQLRDMKSSVNIALLNAAGLSAYGALCGWALALAHARSGDPAQISGYLGASDTADRALTAFASAYADQTERDYAELVRAVKDGRVAARQGV